MIYTRNSFISYLKTKFDCEITPIGDGGKLCIKHGQTARAYMNFNKHIDYEEIDLICRKLYVGFPGNSDLEIVE